MGDDSPSLLGSLGLGLIMAYHPITPDTHHPKINCLALSK